MYARRRVAFLLVLVGAAIAAFLVLRGNDPPAWSPLEIEGDPYAYESGREAEFQKRAAAGHSHVVYTKSPGGVLPRRAGWPPSAMTSRRRPVMPAWTPT